MDGKVDGGIVEWLDSKWNVGGEEGMGEDVEGKNNTYVNLPKS